MVQALLLGVSSFVLSLLVGRPLIRLLQRYRVGKTIRFDGPASHQAKVGTPTMGGLMILGPILLLTVLTNLAGRASMWMPLGVMAGYAALGFYDDLRGVRDRTGVGWLARWKFPS